MGNGLLFPSSAEGTRHLLQSAVSKQDIFILSICIWEVTLLLGVFWFICQPPAADETSSLVHNRIWFRNHSYVGTHQNMFENNLSVHLVTSIGTYACISRLHSAISNMLHNLGSVPAGMPVTNHRIHSGMQCTHFNTFHFCHSRILIAARILWELPQRVELFLSKHLLWIIKSLM